MRMSALFGRTLRETPSDAEMISHQLLLRAGMIRPLGTGVYSYLPLGYRVKAKVEAILREEMDAIGAQEMLMPVVHPAEVWQASGRWHSVDETLVRFQDRTAHDMVLAMTHEEVVADLLQHEVESYRQLPAVVYHIQVKFRDERRPRGGLVRVREFTMKDAYSVHPNIEDLEAFYPTMLQAYQNVWARCALDPIAVEADSGIMGGSASHEFMLLNPEGEDTIVLCESCDYAANAERATAAKQPFVPVQVPGKVMEVATPGCKTIEDVARYVGVPTAQTFKAVFFSTEEPEPRLIFAVIRGDLEVNEVKLSNAVGGLPLRPAEEDEIRAVGAVPGYASPIGVHGAHVVADDSVLLGDHFVVGANREGYHLIGVRYGRDLKADRHCPGPGRRCLPSLQRSAAGRAGHRVGALLQTRHPLHGATGHYLPRCRWGRTPDRHGLVRDGRRPADRCRRRGTPRRIRHLLACQRVAVPGAPRLAGAGGRGKGPG